MGAKENLNNEGVTLEEADTVNFAFAEADGRTGVFWVLISSFAEIEREYPAARLYILGECPGVREMEPEIERLHLQKKVFLMGKAANPWRVEESCHCLPSVPLSAENIWPETFGPLMREALWAENEEVRG